jgi:hypothetical protein
VEPRQFEVAGIHAGGEYSFDDELPEYFLGQEQKHMAAIALFKIGWRDIFREGREPVPPNLERRFYAPPLSLSWTTPNLVRSDRWFDRTP